MEKDLGKIKKNDNTDIIVRIDDFGGKRGLTIREYVTSEKYTGFSKSGTRIPAESFILFRDIINSINYDELMNAPIEKKEKPKPAKKEKKSKTEDSKEEKEEDMQETNEEDLL